MVYKELRRAERNAIAKEVFSKIKARLPITSMKKNCRLNVPHYLYEMNDFKYCTACNHDIELKGKLDKHKSKRFCPRCHKEVTVLRSNCSKNFSDKINLAYPEFIDSGIVMRYFQFNINYKFVDNTLKITDGIMEVAREFVKPNVLVRAEIGWEGNWATISNRDTSGYWFSWWSGVFKNYENKHCCRMAFVFKPLVNELKNKLNELGLGILDDYYYNTDFNTVCNVSDNVVNSVYFKNDTLFEKLHKVKLLFLYHLIPSGNKSKNGSVINNLGVDKLQYKWLLSKENYDEIYHSYSFLLKIKATMPDISIKELNLYYDLYKSKKVNKSSYDWTYSLYLANECIFLRKNLEKKVNYINKHNLLISDYTNYIEMCIELGLEMNSSTICPKNFSKANNEIHELWEEKRDRELAKSKKEQSNQIKKLAKALNKSEEIRKFMDKSKGLIIKVPENAEELIREGSRLHNCLRTYVDKVARKECLVFFVRRIEDTEKEYYAFEYRDGRIVQLRTHNNSHGKDYEVVYTFCTDFIKALQKISLDNMQKVA